MIDFIKRMNEFEQKHVRIRTINASTINRFIFYLCIMVPEQQGILGFF